VTSRFPDRLITFVWQVLMSTCTVGLNTADESFPADAIYPMQVGLRPPNYIHCLSDGVYMCCSKSGGSIVS
jgi:hypothetical protein